MLISGQKTNLFVSFPYVNCVEYIICIATNKEEKVKRIKKGFLAIEMFFVFP